MSDNFRWGYIFLAFDMKIPLEGRLEIAHVAIGMHYAGEDERKVRSDTYGYEGRIYTTGKWGASGCLAGKIYHAEVDGNQGKSTLSFMVCDQTPASETAQGSLN